MNFWKRPQLEGSVGLEATSCLQPYILCNFLAFLNVYFSLIISYTKLTFSVNTYCSMHYQFLGSFWFDPEFGFLLYYAIEG